MGNAMISPCFRPPPPPIKLISYGGATRILTGKHLAGEIMFESPHSMVCHADSFFIGHPVPSLAIEDKLIEGHTYFLLPLDSFANMILSASSLAALASGRKMGPAHFKDSPFEHVKDSNGTALIKVVPEFITRLITNENAGDHDDESFTSGILCNTPELQKQYNQLVGSKDHTWSPKLDTITEYKNIRYSPFRFIGFEWKQNEVNG